MPKKPQILTSSFGSEQLPPPAEEIASWVGRFRGHTADILTIRMAASLLPQVKSGITIPCAGGLCSATRVIPQLKPPEIDDMPVKEPDLTMIAHDARMARRLSREFAMAFPAPSALMKQAPRPPGKEELENLLSGYRMILRIARDEGSRYQVLISKEPDDMEMEELCGRRTLFFPLERTEPVLERVLEFQRILIVSPVEWHFVEDLAGSYRVSKVVIIDADEEVLEQAASVFEHNKIEAGGYLGTGSDPDYWRTLVEKVRVKENQPPRRVF